MTAPALELDGIGKCFGDLVALDAASLSVRQAGRTLGVASNRHAAGRTMHGA